MTMTKSVAALAFLLSAGAAHAETMHPTGQADWSGGYVSVGVSHTRTSYSASGAYAPAKASGTGPSVIIGYNLQQGNIVYGAEVMLNFDDAKGTNVGCGLALTCTSSVENYLSVRARVGYATGQTLIFGTLGVTSDRAEQQVNPLKQSRRHYGLTVGVGAEQALTANWSIRGDLEYHRMGSKGYAIPPFLPATTIKHGHLAARLGVSYKF